MAALNSERPRVLVVFGTRPEAIKMCVLVNELKQYDSDFDLAVCVTAQHREMLDQVLQFFDVAPDYDLDLMQQGQTLDELTGKIVKGVTEVIDKYVPQMMLVHGDTTTCMAASLAAFYKQVPVGHVEAGLRTYDLSAPFPEELNRQLAGRIASIHFAPTIWSAENLVSEGCDESSIYVTGNTVIDALHDALKRMDGNVDIGEVTDTFIASVYKADWRSSKYVLITGHRRENFGDGLKEICRAVADLARENPQVDFVYPVHLNPNVVGPVTEILSGIENVYLLPPLEYLPFIVLLKYSFLVLTDSGGIQEEAPGLGKPVLVMRDTTERPEAVDAGTVKLVGSRSEKIKSGVQRLIDDPNHYKHMSTARNPYGDGTATKKIARVLIDYFRK